MEPALVVVNPRARGGAALRHYRALASRIEERFAVRSILLDRAGAWRAALDGGIVIAAGGDGTVNAVANELLARPKRGALGAIALGSSNDFHKPAARRLAGIPVRIESPRPRDAGVARWEDDRGGVHARGFLVSASVGLVARANARFTRPERLVSAAIARAAAGAIARHEDVPARVALDGGRDEDVALASLSVMLGTHLAGALHYPASTRPPDGSFAVHLAAAMTRAALARAAAGLLFGRFGGRSTFARTVTVALAREDDLELDGELFRARRVTFDVAPQALEVCS